MNSCDFSNAHLAALPNPAPGQRPAACVMVLGTSSGAGKSWLATALCAHYRARGLRVAPFKAQNMSANARPAQLWSPSPSTENADLDRGCPALGPISAAQYLQAQAAGVRPDVRMNPLVLVPTSERASQVVLLGQPRADIAAVPWRERAPLVWPAITAALDSLRAEFDVVVIEGAGSPAEINLRSSDVVNLRVAHYADAHALLVTDIDRGGAFAHLLGTFEALEPADRARIRGFVLNKFRGDAELLSPAPQWLHTRTGVPIVAIVPMQNHALPDEDSLDAPQNHVSRHAPQPAATQRPIAIIALPRLRCQDEFAPLQNAGVPLVWARDVADLQHCGAIIVPASANLSEDLAWLRARGLDAAITQFAQSGGEVLGIAEGANMLGEALIDLSTPTLQLPATQPICHENPANSPNSPQTPSTEKATLGRGCRPSLPDPFAANAPGLGLLPLVTRIEPLTILAHSEQCTITLPVPLRGAVWSAMAGQAMRTWSLGYHPTQLRTDIEASQRVRSSEPIAQRFWQNPAGNINGVLWHGCFENPSFLAAFCAAAARENPQTTLENPNQTTVQTHEENPALAQTFAHMARALPQWFALAANVASKN